jgi:5-(carboxyamino)imidazole ribonucleotide synthase
MKKAGILGGGQLGRMLLQAAINYPVETYVMENDPKCPAAHLCHHFVKGDISNYDDVYRFGKNLDVLTIEIESVNEAALEQLELEGVTIVPSPAALKTIKSKILQKQFYQDNEIPSSDFVITQHKSDLNAHEAMLPAVHKLAMGGYDGRGVQVIKTVADMELGFDAPAVLEKMVDIKIGLDIASMTLKRQVDQIILISGDSDFVPAAKLARREGIDFLLDPMWNPIKPHLFEHIDGLVSKIKRPES